MSDETSDLAGGAPPALAGDDRPGGVDDVLGAIHAMQDAEALFRTRLRKKLGIGASELAAVQFLTRLELRGADARPVDVAAHLGISTSAMSPVVVRLEGRGYLVRRPDPADGRGVRLTLTPAVHAAVLAAAGGGRLGALAGVAGLTDVESRRLVALLAGVTSGFDDGAAPDALLPAS
jgi:DNA-binding MarR family transcriptional regulator